MLRIQTEAISVFRKLVGNFMLGTIEVDTPSKPVEASALAAVPEVCSMSRTLRELLQPRELPAER